MGAGKTLLLFSGAITGNSYDYRKFNTLGFGVTQVNFDVVEVTSGTTLDYMIRGYPSIDQGDGAPTYRVPVLGTTSIGSGYVGQYLVRDGYERIDVGIKNTTTDKSGALTVSVTGKRRQ